MLSEALKQHCRSLLTRNKDLFDRSAKQRCNFESEWEAGIVPARFDRVDRLAGHVELVGDFRLRKITLGPEDAETVLHQYFRER